MKHYYSDEGILQYVPPEEIVLKLLNAVVAIYGENASNVSVKYEIFNKSFDIQESYEIYSSTTGILSLEEWFAEVDKDTIVQILKELAQDFGKEYLIEEFPWAVFAVACTVELDLLLGRVVDKERSE